MRLSVKEVSELAKVTVKTLHHYHKIGLLVPAEVTEAGYRLYGDGELERLQQILFYRELDFPLEQIKELLAGRTDRGTILKEQKELLLRKRRKLGAILETLEQSIAAAERGEPMDGREMFRGFDSEAAWAEALEEQNRHLKESYGVDLLDSERIDAPTLNEQAAEAADFMARMAEALRDGIKHNDEEVGQLIRLHLKFLERHGHPARIADFVEQTRFFREDDFHRRMLEGQQTGLAYYLAAAAESLMEAAE
ncbi:MerR family transcriptional regulator [Paenibacillus faecis]|uniref:MerR family transcriptional regulator n=1 Tax=Paenibacillus faecis TaxID=862114 RepID=UPI001B2AA819|nr:MerR family transcriptional regulator [Paenibacillus faecis]GIO86650.1 MerR family transcriptional regulator [Paenibacillus faecis]